MTLEGHIASWNAGAERLYHIPAIAAVGKPISLVVPPDQLRELLRAPGWHPEGANGRAL